MKFLKVLLLKLFPNYFANRLIRRAKNKAIYIYGGYEVLSHLKENCEYFLSKAQLADEKFMENIARDIIKSYLLYGTNANEYFCYKFPTLTAKQRNTYLPRKRKDEMLIKQMGNNCSEIFDQLKDKYNFYKMAGDFFGREACLVTADGGYDVFAQFIQKHKRVIAKPLRGGCGVGITILDLEDFKNDAKVVFDYLMTFDTPFIVEELVKQDDRLSEWNRSSINTLRIPSFRTKDGIRIVYPSIRVGRAGSIVDNAGNGGTFAAIDSQTGRIITKGYDKRGNTYDHHPDSGKTYLGSQIPMWDELLTFVSELHCSMAKAHKYIAFDLALSTKGWVVIEANWGEMTMPQVEFNKGLYKEFKELLYN